MDRIMAEMVFFKRDKGWGIAQDLDARTYFVHIKYIHEKKIPNPGDLLTFAVRTSLAKPDKTEAYDIRIVKRANPAPAFEVPIAPTIVPVKAEEL